MTTAFPIRVLVLAAFAGSPLLLAAESTVRLEDLPLPVRTAITENTRGAAVERITSDKAQGTVVYTATFRDAQDRTPHAIRIGHDGKLLAEGPSTSEPSTGVPSTGVPLGGAAPANGPKP